MDIYKNWNCDGKGPHYGQEVRVYPLGAGGHLNLCRLCWDQENLYRRSRRVKNGQVDNRLQNDWHQSEVYRCS